MVNLIWRNPDRFASAGSYDGTLSLFNFNQMTAAGEPYFARLRPVQFLLHSAAVAPSNLNTNRQFESLLNIHGIHNTFDNLLFSSSSQHNWWNADEHMVRALPLHWSKFLLYCQFWEENEETACLRPRQPQLTEKPTESAAARASQTARHFPERKVAKIRLLNISEPLAILYHPNRP